jgi:MerR family copper efflux transcriptional regulator
MRRLTLKWTSRFILTAMPGLQVAELAERAGVAPSTVRYYERVGLLSPARRAPNGYRLFDESALEELAFVHRAKGIGMSLEDITDLLAAWPHGECRALQARLRAFLVERIEEVHQQLGQLGAFERQLHSVLSRLSARDPGPEPCGKGCGCETDLDVHSDGAIPDRQPWGCSLDVDELGARIAEWRTLAASATSLQRLGGTVQLIFEADPLRIASVAQLCGAEAACCVETRFVMKIDAEQVTLTAEAPGAPGLLDALFPPATPDRW